jgi:hypothetical protein
MNQLKPAKEVPVSEIPDSRGADDAPGTAAPIAGISEQGGQIEHADQVDPATSAAAPQAAAAEPSSAEVGRALAELGGVSALDLAHHPDAYQRIHVELQNALASIDDA